MIPEFRQTFKGEPNNRTSPLLFVLPKRSCPHWKKNSHSGSDKEVGQRKNKDIIAK